MNVSWYFESSEVMTDRVDAFNVVYLAQDSTGAIDSMSPDKYVFLHFFRLMMARMSWTIQEHVDHFILLRI